MQLSAQVLTRNGREAKAAGTFASLCVAAADPPPALNLMNDRSSPTVPRLLMLWIRVGRAIARPRMPDQAIFPTVGACTHQIVPNNTKYHHTSPPVTCDTTTRAASRTASLLLRQQLLRTPSRSRFPSPLDRLFYRAVQMPATFIPTASTNYSL
jgi:hypothetical protein